MDKKFNDKHLHKLNRPERLEMIPPNYIWQLVDLKSCQAIADIGAGTGLFSQAFLKFIPNGLVYALDISDPMIEWMKDHIKNPAIHPIKMFESSIPLDDDMVDLALMITLHHELDDPIKSLKETRRLLKDQGKICIVDWKKEDTDHGPPYSIKLDVKTIEDQVKQAGFNHIKTDTCLDHFNIIIGQK